MNISGIRPSSGFYDYTKFNIDALKAEEEANVADNKAVATEEKLVTDEEIAEAKSKQTFSSFDFSKQYDASKYAENFDDSNGYSYKGSESELKNLDVMRAISDMEKDKAIQRYQYFVGDRDKADFAIGIEDFSL